MDGADRGSDAAAPGPRRIWEVDVDALLVVVPLVLGREGMRRVLANHGLAGAANDAALAYELVARCQRPCTLADEVERALDRRTSRLRQFALRCPTAVLSGWWAGADEEERPALLWCVASDPRFDLDAARCRGAATRGAAGPG
ncbi:MAG: hypothetical protein ACJ79L_07715 [Anaeromyxobacteraceae bacterium]